MLKCKKRADGRYLAQIQIGFHNNGKPKYKNLYGKTRAELEEKVIEFKSNLSKGIIINDKNITVGKWADMWLETYKKGVAHNTYRRYQSIIDIQIKPFLGSLKLKSVTLYNIQNTLNKLAETYSISTIKKVKDTLSQMYQQAIIEQYVYVNPCVGIKMPTAHQETRTSIPEEDVKHITDFCKDKSYGPFVLTLLYTGMRRGEIVALTWKDIDLKKSTINVNKAVEYINNRPFTKTPKTKNSYREIPIFSILLPYFKELKRSSVKETVFVNAQGNMHTETSLKRLWARFLKEYSEYCGEEKKYTMHQFRHTFATILFNAGADVKTAQALLGHSSINITLEIYTHLEKQKKNISIEKIEDYLNKNQSKISQNKKIINFR